MFYFYPQTLGKWSNLTNSYFSDELKLNTTKLPIECRASSFRLAISVDACAKLQLTKAALDSRNACFQATVATNTVKLQSTVVKLQSTVAKNFFLEIFLIYRYYESELETLRMTISFSKLPNFPTATPCFSLFLLVCVKAYLGSSARFLNLHIN